MISRTWLTFVIGKYRTSDLTIRLLMEYCGTRSHFSTRNPFHPLPLTLFVPLLELVAGTARYFPSFLRGNFCSFTIQPDCRLLLVIRYIPGTITRKSLVKSDSRVGSKENFSTFSFFFFFRCCCRRTIYLESWAKYREIWLEGERKGNLALFD